MWNLYKNTVDLAAQESWKDSRQVSISCVPFAIKYTIHQHRTVLNPLPLRVL
jgi:hypothetical protein